MRRIRSFGVAVPIFVVQHVQVIRPHDVAAMRPIRVTRNAKRLPDLRALFSLRKQVVNPATNRVWPRDHSALCVARVDVLSYAPANSHFGDLRKQESANGASPLLPLSLVLASKSSRRLSGIERRNGRARTWAVALMWMAKAIGTCSIWPMYVLFAVRRSTITRRAILVGACAVSETCRLAH